MKNLKNVSLDSLAVLAIGSGIAMLSAATDKWYIGVILVAVGIGLSFTKYHLR